MVNSPGVCLRVVCRTTIDRRICFYVFDEMSNRDRRESKEFRVIEREQGNRPNEQRLNRSTIQPYRIHRPEHQHSNYSHDVYIVTKVEFQKQKT